VLKFEKVLCGITIRNEQQDATNVMRKVLKNCIENHFHL